MVKTEKVVLSTIEDLNKYKNYFEENEKIVEETILIDYYKNFSNDIEFNLKTLNFLRRYNNKLLKNENLNIETKNFVNGQIEYINNLIKKVNDQKNEEKRLACNKMTLIIEYLKSKYEFNKKFNIVEAQTKKALNSEEYNRYIMNAMKLANYQTISYDEFFVASKNDTLSEEIREYYKKNKINAEDELKKISEYKDYISNNILTETLKDVSLFAKGKYINKDNVEQVKNNLLTIEKDINDCIGALISPDESNFENKIFGQERKIKSDGKIINSNIKTKEISEKEKNRDFIKLLDMNKSIIKFLINKKQYLFNFENTDVRSIEKNIDDLMLQNRNIAFNLMNKNILSSNNVKRIVKINEEVEDIVSSSREPELIAYDNELIAIFEKNKSTVKMFNAKIEQILTNKHLNNQNKSELYLLNLMIKNLCKKNEEIINSCDGVDRNFLINSRNELLPELIDCSKYIKNISQLEFNNKEFSIGDINAIMQNIIDRNGDLNNIVENKNIYSTIMNPNNINCNNGKFLGFTAYKSKNDISPERKKELKSNMPFKDEFVKKTLIEKIDDVKEKRQLYKNINMKGKFFFKNLFKKVDALFKYGKAKVDLYFFKHNKFVDNVIKTPTYVSLTVENDKLEEASKEFSEKVQEISSDSNTLNNSNMSAKSENNNEENSDKIKEEGLLKKVYLLLTNRSQAKREDDSLSGNNSEKSSSSLRNVVNAEDLSDTYTSLENSISEISSNCVLEK